MFCPQFQSLCTKLHEINLGNNQLKWLPWEFLSLLGFWLSKDLKKCILHPNPFIRPVPSMWGGDDYHDFGNDYEGHFASTHVAFLDITGHPERDYSPSPASKAEHWIESSGNKKSLRPPPHERHKPPSLMDIAIRACYKHPQLSQLHFFLPGDCPDYLRELLQSTWRLKKAGSQTCSVCGSEYIIPRTEWIEWWYCITGNDVNTNSSSISPDDFLPLPFLRRGCSWQCFTEKPAESFIRGWSSATQPGGRKEVSDFKCYV